MRTITELSTEELRVVGDAVETVIDLRAYLPTDGMLIMLAGRFRDDIREELGVPPLKPAGRGSEPKQLDELGDDELDRLATAVSTLMGRFGPFMEDPALVTLLGDLHARLTMRVFERANAAEEAKAS
jgi:hypothetical protein